MSIKQEKATIRVQELDALRGIAAILVVLYHFTLFYKDTFHFFKFGSTGVDLFFMISGFVIYKSIEKTSNGIHFLINRFTRLYPVYWAVVTFTFSLIIIKLFEKYGCNFSIIPWANYWSNMSMFQHYFKIDNLDGPYWTLIIEMNFYLIIFVFLLIKKINFLEYFLMLISALNIFSIFTHINLPFFNSFFTFIPGIYWFPLFLSGIYFYKILYNKGNKKLNHFFVFLNLAIQTLIFINHHVHNPSDVTLIEHLFLVYTYHFIFYLFVYQKLKWIVNKLSLFLGKISYSLYLCHQYVALTFIIPFGINVLGLSLYKTIVLIVLPIIILIAFLFNKLIEIPFQNKLRSIIKLKN